MTDIEKLKEAELMQLTEEEEEEIYDLESLVTDGANARFPVKFKYPKQEPDGSLRMVNAGALIRPLTNVEWNNCVRMKRTPNSKTSNEVELLKKALYNTNGEQMNPKVVESLPNGVALELVKLVSEISGVDYDENLKMAKEMMGFSV